MTEERIKEFSGRTIGFIKDNGTTRIATDFSGRQLGYYDKQRNVTCDFYGRPICTGDATTGLVLNAKKD